MTSDRTRLAAAFTLAALSFARTARAQSAADEARRHYRAGAELVRNGNCRDALGEFRQSITLVDSPNTRLLYARCLNETGDLVGALAEFERTERDAAVRAPQESRYAATRDAARDEGAQVSARLGRVVLILPRGERPSSIRVAGREIQPGEYSGVPVNPGAVTIEATWNGTTRTQEANVGVGARLEVRLAAPTVDTEAVPSQAPDPIVSSEPPPRDTPTAGGPPGWIPFVIGGIGVAGLAAGGGLYGGAWSQYSASMNSCRMACTDDQLSLGRGLEIGAYVSFGIGAALVAGGVISFIVLRRAPASVRAHIEPGSHGLTIRF